MFMVTIETGNDAFMPDAGPELARLLRDLADTVSDGALPRYTEASGTMRDINGTTVLQWSWKGEHDDD